MTASYRLKGTANNRIVFFNTTPNLPETYEREKEISLPEGMDFDIFQSKISDTFLRNHCTTDRDRCKVGLYHCENYKELGHYFSKALGIAPDNVSELISIYNKCSSDSTKVNILFSVIHLVNRNAHNYDSEALSIVKKDQQPVEKENTMIQPQSFSREEVKRAYKTLWDIFNTACYSLDTEEQEMEMKKELEDNVLSLLPDEPEITMAETAWCSKEHYLAEATLYYEDQVSGYCAIGKVVMLKEVDDNIISAMRIDTHFNGVFNYRKDRLVPTGKYYKVVEEEE